MFCIDNVLQGVVFYKLQSVVKGGEDMEKNIQANEQKMLATLSSEEVVQLKRMLRVIYTNLE